MVFSTSITNPWIYEFCVNIKDFFEYYVYRFKKYETWDLNARLHKDAGYLVFIFFSRFEGMRGDKNQIIRTKAKLLTGIPALVLNWWLNNIKNASKGDLKIIQLIMKWPNFDWIIRQVNGLAFSYQFFFIKSY